MPGQEKTKDLFLGTLFFEFKRFFRDLLVHLVLVFDLIPKRAMNAIVHVLFFISFLENGSGFSYLELIFYLFISAMLVTLSEKCSMWSMLFSEECFTSK